MRKVATVTAVVVLLHLAVLWAVQNRLATRPEKVVVPVAMVMLAPPLAKPVAPSMPATPAAIATPATPAKVPVAPARSAAKPLQSEQTVTAPSAPEAPKSPAPIPDAPAAPPSAIAAATATATAVQVAANPPSGAAQAATAAVELPSSDAQYLHNPKPTYPRASRQRGEQGRVVVNVLIGTDGTAQQAEIKVSSGFERLDLAALRTAKAWRYVPGKRGGVPEAMWYAVPLNFAMEGQ